jgi:ribonucleoside-diphosphate reductase alpha chain
MDGRYVPSLLAAIGGIIEAHMLRTGFLERPLGGPLPSSAFADDGASGDAIDAPQPPWPAHQVAAADHAVLSAASVQAPRPVRHCPRCFSDALDLIGGCWVCYDCGYAKCG